MPLDVEKYRHYVAGFNLSEQEQVELIQNVWTILQGFVDQAFDRDLNQRCRSSLELSHLQNRIEFLESDERDAFVEAQSVKPDPLKH